MVAALVTDSASALSPSVCRRLGIELVELRVLVEGLDCADTEVDHAGLYGFLGREGRVTTSQPTPADIHAAYARAVARGAGHVWSVHVGSALSGTLNAARLSAQQVPVSVDLVDTGTASMPEGLCVLAALAALERDASSDISAVVRAEAEQQENVFVSLTPALIERSGRGQRLAFASPLPVLSLRQGSAVEEVGQASDLDHAVELIARRVSAIDRVETLAVGEGGAPSWGSRLFEAVRKDGAGSSKFRYQVPASIAAHTGPSFGVVVSRTALTPPMRAALESV